MKTLTAATLAGLFHETYERLAPAHGYETRDETAKPWAEIPDDSPNKTLMITVAEEVLAQLGGHLLDVEQHDTLQAEHGGLVREIDALIRGQDLSLPGEGPPLQRLRDLYDHMYACMIPDFEHEALMQRLTDAGVPITVDGQEDARILDFQERVGLMLDRYWKLREEMARLRTQKRLHPGAAPKAQDEPSPSAEGGLVRILGEISKATTLAGGLRLSYGRDPVVEELTRQNAALMVELNALRIRMEHNDQTASAVIGRMETEQRQARCKLSAIGDRLDEAETGLACGHDCGGYSCPTLRADWKREGFSCPNGGCPSSRSESP